VVSTAASSPVASWARSSGRWCAPAARG
jgi:hypothetical protein